MALKKLGANTATTAAAPVAKAVGFNPFDMQSYGGGAFIPEGDYATFHLVKMHQAEDKQTGAKKGPELLGVMITFIPLSGVTEENPQREKFYSAGKNAHKSFMPSADGKGFVPVPNAPSTQLNNQTNWFYYMKSLKDAGMANRPDGLPVGAVNGFAELDGVWVHVHSIPEPEERKTMQSASTAEAQSEFKGNGTISVVGQILPGGAPWEGGGGMPKGGKVIASASKGAPSTQSAAAVADAPEVDSDLRDAAEEAITTVLTKNPNGMAKLKLQMAVFKKSEDDYGSDIAEKITSAFFEDDAALGGILNGLGFKVDGKNIAAA